MTQPSRAEIRARILAAARELFCVDGVRGVTMADIARGAGCARQTVYKVFFDRRELVLTAIVERVVEIADAAMLAAPVSSDSFIESFVEVSIQVIEALRGDAELSALFGEGSPVTAHEALWAPELTERALRFWQPWLDFGRDHHLLRNDLSNEDLADWLHTVYASIILRRNVPQQQERTMIERFVMTSLAMASAAPSG